MYHILHICLVLFSYFFQLQCITKHHAPVAVDQNRSMRNSSQSLSSSPYCSLNVEHTMCKYQGLSPECEKMVRYRGVTETGRKVILDKHNQLRRRIARGEEGRGLGGRGQPPAADMRRLGW